MVRILQMSGPIDMILVAIDSWIPNYIVNVILFLRFGVYYKKYTRVKLDATCFARVLEYIYIDSRSTHRKCTWRETLPSVVR